MNPRVSRVHPVSGHRLLLTFTNGEQGVFDCRPYLEFGVFRELQKENYFRRVRVEGGTVAWPHEQDICPDTLYLESDKSAEGIAEDAVGTDATVKPPSVRQRRRGRRKGDRDFVGAYALRAVAGLAGDQRGVGGRVRCHAGA